MRRRAFRGVLAILIVWALPGIAVAQDAPAIDDAAVALMAGTIAATRAADSMHVSVTGSGSIPGGDGGALTLEGASIEADLDLAHQAAAIRADLPSLDLTGLELRVIDGKAYIRAAGLLTSDDAWWATDASFVTDTLGLLVPGTGRLMRGDLQPTGVEAFIRRRLGRASASAEIVGEQSCSTGTCTRIHVEAPLPADSAGLIGLLGGAGAVDAEPAASGAPVDRIVTADVLVDAGTTRLKSIVVTQRSEQGEITITIAVDAYDAPVTVTAPPPDQISDELTD